MNYNYQMEQCKKYSNSINLFFRVGNRSKRIKYA